MGMNGAVGHRVGALRWPCVTLLAVSFLDRSSSWDTELAYVMPHWLKSPPITQKARHLIISCYWHPDTQCLPSTVFLCLVPTLAKHVAQFQIHGKFITPFRLLAARELRRFTGT